MFSIFTKKECLIVHEGGDLDTALNKTADESDEGALEYCDKVGIED